MTAVALALMTPFLVKTSSNFAAKPELVKSEKCEVYSDRVVVTKNFFGKTLSYTINLKTDSLSDLVSMAKNEELEVLGTSTSCEGARTKVMAYDNSEEVLLYSSMSCDDALKMRQGVYTYSLIEIANTFCPKTY